MPKPYNPNDVWSQRAAKEGYRARSVYKLQELDKRFHLLSPGIVVVDLGAAPGSWMQYASKMVGSFGHVYGFDLQKIAPIERNVTLHQVDMTKGFAVEELLQKDGIRTVDLVLSDAAPNTSGIQDVDQWKSVELAQACIAIAQNILKRGGFCVLKVFRGADFDPFMHDLKNTWENVKVVTVKASRDRSKEVYVVARK